MALRSPIRQSRLFVGCLVSLAIGFLALLGMCAVGTFSDRPDSDRPGPPSAASERPAPD